MPSAPRLRRAHDSSSAFDALLLAARDGAPWAWQHLYEWLAPAVAGYLRAQGAAEVEDLTSETFLGVLRGIARFGGDEAQFRSWVFVIAHRRVQDERRRRAARGTPSPLDDAATPSEPVAVEGTEADALRNLATERVRYLCAQLVPDQRDVILLRLVADLTVDQVAQVLGKTPGAVKALQRGASRRCRVIERSANLAVTACSDTTVVHGTTYQYMVLWLAADGTTLAHSNHVAVTP